MTTRGSKRLRSRPRDWIFIYFLYFLMRIVLPHVTFSVAVGLKTWKISPGLSWRPRSPESSAPKQDIKIQQELHGAAGGALLSISYAADGPRQPVEIRDSFMTLSSPRRQPPPPPPVVAFKHTPECRELTGEGGFADPAGHQRSRAGRGSIVRGGGWKRALLSPPHQGARPRRTPRNT